MEEVGRGWLKAASRAAWSRAGGGAVVLPLAALAAPLAVVVVVACPFAARRPPSRAALARWPMARLRRTALARRGISIQGRAGGGCFRESTEP